MFKARKFFHGFFRKQVRSGVCSKQAKSLANIWYAHARGIITYYKKAEL
jgi:hypothetical protein